MRLRAVPMRAILLPLGVALASSLAVAWYGLVKIPAQQRYITDRNLWRGRDRAPESLWGLPLTAETL